MSAPTPISPSATHTDPEQVINAVNVAVLRALEVVGLPLSISLDGQSVAEGSAAEAIMTADRYQDLLIKQRTMQNQARPFGIGQVVRG